MTPEEIEQLLNKSENPCLDFKRQEYVFFDPASDDDKSELLKDILKPLRNSF